MKIKLTAIGTALILLGVPVSVLEGRDASQAEPPGSAVAGHNHEGTEGANWLRLEKMIRCQCGCNLDLHTCQNQMQCGESPVWSQRILMELRQGRSDDEIVSDFVDEFGEVVLMAPPARGFNLLAWVLPVGALLTTGLVIGLALRRTSGPAAVPADGVSPEGWAKIEEELKKLDV